MLALILAMLLGQTQGGPGFHNKLEIQCIDDAWITIGLPASALGVSPGSEPDWVQVPSGQTTYLRGFADNAVEFLAFTLKTIPQYKEGEDIPVGLQWSPTTTDLGDVSWALDCGHAATGQAWPNPTRYAALSAGGGTVNILTAVELGTIDGTGKTIAGGFNCTILRLAGLSGDPADDYAGDAALAGVTFAFPVDSVASGTPLTKGWPCASP